MSFYYLIYTHFKSLLSQGWSFDQKQSLIFEIEKKNKKIKKGLFLDLMYISL